MVVLYLAPGQGLAGSNLVTLTEAGAYLKGYGLPFVLLGDFNMEEEEELDMVLMERFLKGMWARPTQPVPGGHSAIDLVMVSEVLAGRAR